MGRSLLLLALPVLLQSVLTEANVECFSNVMPNDTGIASNGACQVSYSLTKVNGCDVITGEPRLSAVGRHHQKVLRDPSEVIVLDRCRFDGNSIVCNCETDFCNQNFYSLWPSFLNLYINSSDECRQDWIAAAPVIVFNYTSYEFYNNDDEPSQITPSSLLTWLENLSDGIRKGTIHPLGGRALTTRLRRMFFEVYSNISQMFHTQPLLSSCLFGVPIGFLSIICYSICSADFSVDREEFYPDEEEDMDDEEQQEEYVADPDHQKNE